MAVETRYAVIHNGEEKRVTTNKTEADRYDKMLNVADNLTEYLKVNGVLSDDMNEATVKLVDDISVALSQGKDDVKKLFAGKSVSELSKQ